MIDSALTGIVYDDDSWSLWRWVDARQDAQVREFVEAFRGLDASRQREVRSAMDGPAAEALRCYALRCALAAIRSRAPVHVVDGFDALSIIDADAYSDPRDIAAAAMLLTYAGRRLRLRLRRTVAPAVARSTPFTAKLLRDYLPLWLFLPRRLPSFAGYREISSPWGPGFASDGLERFRPRTDLIAAVCAAAEVIEAERYHPHDLTVGAEVYPVRWRADQRPAVAGMVDHARGCATVAGRRSEGHDLDVFYAEAASDADAAAMAAAVEELPDPRRPSITAVQGQFCVVAVASTMDSTINPVENLATLERFRSPLVQILQSLAV